MIPTTLNLYVEVSIMKRKRSKKTRAVNAAEKRFMGFCKTGPCVACNQGFISEAHHCEGSTYKRKVNLVTVLIGHWFVIPLCTVCHQFFHNNKIQFIDAFGTQEKLWLEVYSDFIDTGAKPAPMDVIQGIVEPD